MTVRICPEQDAACSELQLCATCPERAGTLDMACAMEQSIDEYLTDYRMEGDTEFHIPTELELFLIKDAIMGLLVDSAFVAAQSTCVYKTMLSAAPGMSDNAMVNGGEAVRTSAELGSDLE